MAWYTRRVVPHRWSRTAQAIERPNTRQIAASPMYTCTVPVPPRRVLASSWEYDPNIVGGMGRHVTALLHAMGVDLPDSPYEIHLLTPAFPGAPPYEQVGQRVFVHRFPWLDQAAGNVYDDTRDLVDHTLELNRQLLAKAHALAQEHPMSLIHAHDWLTASSALELRRAWQVPLVTTFHATEMGRHYGHIVTDLNRRIHEWEAALCRASDKVIVCSHYMRDSLVDSFQCSPEQFDIIPNGVCGQGVCKTEDAVMRYVTQRFKGHGEFLLLFVGRPAHCKGLHVLLDAMSLILPRHPRVHLAVAGQDSLDLNPDIAARGLTAHVSLLGYIADSERNCLLQAADAAVMPSLYEPFGIVALEAMAAGCPVVASNVGGLAEVIDHAETGLTVTPGDPHSIAWAVDHLITHPEQSRQRVSAAQKKVARHFRWDRISALTQRVYDAALDLNLDQEV